MTEEEKPEPVQFGFTQGKICFEADDDIYARFLIQLRNEGIGKSEFFRALLKAYIEEDERVMGFINDHRERKQSAIRQRRLDKSRQKGKERVRENSFSEDEINSIFDIIEEEVEL